MLGYAKRRKKHQKEMANFLEYILSLKDKITPGLKQVAVSADGTKQKINQVENQVDNLDKSMRKASGGGISVFKIALGNMLATAAVSLASFGPAIANGIYDGTVKREQDIIGLTTFVGDHAKKVYANIQKDAAATPFDTEALLNVNRALISSGLSADVARKDTMNLANAISAVGKGNAELANMAANMQQIKTVGKASSMDIKQFAFAGINVYKMLQEATGKTIEEVQKMEVSYDLLSFAMEKAAGKGGIYEGALEKQGKTLGAMMGTVKDQASIMMADFGDMLRPMFEKGLVYMQAFVDKLPQIISVVQPVVMALGNSFFLVIDAIAFVINKVNEGSPVFVGLAIVLGSVLSAMLLLKAAALAQAAWTGIVTLATSGWTAVQWALNAAMLANPIGLIIGLVIALAAAIGYIIYRLDGWGVMWEKTTTGMRMMWDGFVGSFQLQWFLAEHYILTGIENLKRAWYSLKSLWDADGAQQALNEIDAKQQQRQTQIVNKAKEVQRNLISGGNLWYEGMNSTKWNNKSFGDIKNDVSDKLGISPAGIPGLPTVPTSFGDAGTSSGRGGGGRSGGGRSSESVATGGQKNVTVNVHLGNAIGTFNLTTATLTESVDKIKDIIIDTVTRSVSTGASLGAA